MPRPAPTARAQKRESVLDKIKKLPAAVDSAMMKPMESRFQRMHKPKKKKPA